MSKADVQEEPLVTTSVDTPTEANSLELNTDEHQKLMLILLTGGSIELRHPNIVMSKPLVLNSIDDLEGIPKDDVPRKRVIAAIREALEEDLPAEIQDRLKDIPPA